MKACFARVTQSSLTRGPLAKRVRALLLKRQPPVRCGARPRQKEPAPGGSATPHRRRSPAIGRFTGRVGACDSLGPDPEEFAVSGRSRDLDQLLAPEVHGATLFVAPVLQVDRAFKGERGARSAAQVESDCGVGITSDTDDLRCLDWAALPEFEVHLDLGAVGAVQRNSIFGARARVEAEVAAVAREST